MELNVKAISLATGITAGIVSVICTAAFALAPEQAVSVGSLLMHGVAVQARPLTAVNAVAGIVLAIAFGIIVGAVFAGLNNKLLKK